MLKLLKIVRDAGEVTTKYPFAPAAFTPTFRGKPEYDPKRCIACAACIKSACPSVSGAANRSRASPSRSALVRMDVPASRLVCTVRAEDTRAAISALPSRGGGSARSIALTGSTSTWRSIRSSSGPDTLD